MELVLEGPSILDHPVQIPDMASQANKRDIPLLEVGLDHQLAKALSHRF